MVKIKYLILFLAFLFALLFLSCKQKKEINLDWAISQLNKIDKKYGGDWHGESIPIKMMPMENILDAISEIKKLTKEANDNKLLMELFEARENALLAQFNFQKAKAFGDEGTIDWYIDKETKEIVVNETINCSHGSAIVGATIFYNKSLQNAHKAFSLLDDVLQNSVEAKQKIGINRNKPRFYYSKLFDIKVTIDVHRNVLKYVCKTII